MDDRDRFEELLEVLDDLAEDNLTRPIIVEGKRDIISLRRVGCKGAVVALHSGEPLFTFAERLATEAREVILLTDWDKKGEILFDALSTNLSANGVRVDRSYRESIYRWLRPPIKDVESLATYVARNLTRYHESSRAPRRSDVGGEGDLPGHH